MRRHQPVHALRSGIRARRWAVGWAVLVWLGLFAAVDTPWLSRLELQAFDLLFLLRGPRPPRSDCLAIVEVDNRSLESGELGGYPFRRREFARLIRNLRAAGASQIVLDHLFLDPAPIPDDDRQLAAAMRDAGCVWLAADCRFSDGLPQPRDRWLSQALGPAPPGGPTPARSISAPLPELVAAARGIGAINVRADSDYSVRRIPLVQVCDGLLVPSLSFAVACDRLGLETDSIAVRWRDSIAYGDRAVPIDGLGCITLDFLGAPAGTALEAGGTAASPFARFSFLDVWRGDGVPPGALAGKTVLVGWTGTGAKDFYSTPFAGQTPGLELHAAAVENLLAGRTLRTAPRPVNNLLLLLMAALPAVMMPRLRSFWACVAYVVLAVGYFDVCTIAFLRYAAFVDQVAPQIALLAVFVGSAALRLAGEEQATSMLQRAFEFYVSPEVLAKLAAAGDGVLSLHNAERREVTVVFADIIGFTAMSERMDPGETMKLLNEYLTDISVILMRYGAYIDKYLGDGLMAVFNAFGAAAYPDHALRAVRAAVEMQAVTHRLRHAAERRGDAAFGLAIGINTGVVVAGNLGSEARAQYSVIGETVNIASRIETQCRQLEANILIGQPTHEQCSYYLDIGYATEVHVKGVSEALTVYEVLGVRHEEELPEY